MKQFVKVLLLTLLAACAACGMAFSAMATDVQPVYMDDITVVNTLTGDTPSSSKTFTFELSSDTGAPLPDATTVSISGAGSATFGDILYTEADIYEYTLTQTSSSASYYTLDTTEYHLLVYVVYDGDQSLYVKAIYATTAENPDAKVASLTFTNKYTAPAVATATEVPVEEEPEPTATPTPVVAAVATASPEPTAVATATAAPVVSAATAAPTDDTLEDVTIEDEAVALEDGGLWATLQDMALPLAGLLSTGDSWALVNLILAVVTVAVSIVLIVGYFLGRKAKDEDDEAEAAQGASDADATTTKRNNKGFARAFSAVPALVAAYLFIMTQDMTMPMAYIDKWTLAMVLIALIQVFVAIVSRKKDKDPDQGD